MAAISLEAEVAPAKVGARRRRQARSELLWQWSLRLGSFAIFALLWELSTHNLQSLLLPTFLGTVQATWELAITGTIWEPLWLSNQALIVGYLISVVVGVPLGLLLARFRRAERFADVYLNAAITAPMAALIPLFIMFFGIGLLSRVIIVIAFTLVIIVIDTRAGVREVDQALVEMARSFGAGEGRIWRRILLPGATPAIVAGLRVGLGRAFTGMVLSELLLVSVGVGRLMLRFRGSFDGSHLYAVVLFVVLESTVCMALLRVLENRILGWASDVSR